ncbi:error-prone DNA polymerase [Rhodobium orientis]|uniref:Error-prone DNA polymerase n=1 Tax=Rhodobium orientis TaxID=34017 RepID=A0A327JK81_9HYPH|nr:error-prone DNA polymerase [Rhodobium orientis]MBB4301325.1 error-prone DNA polymerase [Rhodobium orientis]MBK5951086.1 error-prone DNA polymerase [Rhodobium orientis]RAI26850.1 error-prone DNA polymerase [Rhodobium orientis]
MTAYAELAATSNFSFLRGASHPQELVAEALRLGHTGLGIADRNSVAGVVRAHGAFKDLEAKLQAKTGRPVPLPFRLAVGSRLVFCDGTPEILAYPQNRTGWASLCRLLSLGKLRAEKGDCLIRIDDLLAALGDLLLVVMPGEGALESDSGPHSAETSAPSSQSPSGVIAGLDPAIHSDFQNAPAAPRGPPGRSPVVTQSGEQTGERDILFSTLSRLIDAAPGAVWLAASMLYRGDDRRRLIGLKTLAEEAGVPLLAVNDVLYHRPERRPLQDVVTCIREGLKLASAGRRLNANAERHLKYPEEMARLFRDAPEAIAETGRLLERIDFSLDELCYEYPEEMIPPGKSPQGWLEELTWKRARWRYPDGVPAKVEKLLIDELTLISDLDYARYFLTIHDIVRFAEDRGILCQGRGSAANSAVCYVLGITAVDPAEHDLLFARFISAERKEPPDIDVDFEHERREEVIQHIYQRYGRERAGIAATVIRYRPKSAIREVGKVFGLTEDVTARLAGTVWGSWGDNKGALRVREAGLDPENPLIKQAVDLAGTLLGFPRHLSQHVGGFVLTRGRLDELVPIGNAAMADRTFIEWDKDDIDTLGLMKVDVLALGMLTCIRKCFELMRGHCGLDHDLASIPQEDGAVYEMLQRGDSIGVFQVESRAQIAMLPRLKPKEFYDLVIEVAIVRPGPIQGDMVHPYLRRRNGEEAVHFPSPAPPHDPDELRNVLSRTLGVPLFQEQAMKVAIVAAEFTADEANGLRRAMATFRHLGTIHSFEEKMVEGMVRRGYERDFAERCFNQIKGFGDYGFPESHAASFAKLVYVSAWIKCHHPAVFACGLLNAQPMGFYAPAQIVRDAREHGVEVRGPDINASFWDNTLEEAASGALTLRLGFRQIDGFREDWAKTLTDGREDGYGDVETLWRRTGLPHGALKKLADADAFRSLKLDRREALWAVRRLPDDAPLPLFAAAEARELGEEPQTLLPEMPMSEHVVTDYQTLRLSLKAHPLSFLRKKFADEGIIPCAGLADLPDAAFVRCAGVVIIRQRPGKGNAIFMTLEDETGIANALIWARRFERFRREIMSARLAVVEGRIQKSTDGVIHLIASAVRDRSADLAALQDDEVASGPPARARHPRNVRVIPKSRDFH